MFPLTSLVTNYQLIAMHDNWSAELRRSPPRMWCEPTTRQPPENGNCLSTMCTTQLTWSTRVRATTAAAPPPRSGASAARPRPPRPRAAPPARRPGGVRRRRLEARARLRDVGAERRAFGFAGSEDLMSIHVYERIWGGGGRNAHRCSGGKKQNWAMLSSNGWCRHHRKREVAAGCLTLACWVQENSQKYTPS